MSESKQIEPIKREQFGLSIHRTRRFSATVPSGTTKEDIENPKMWAHVRQQLQATDEIRVLSEDGSFVAECIVRYVDGFAAFVSVIFAVTLATISTTGRVAAQDRYTVEQRGHLGWCVVDKETGKNIREKLARKSDAERELEQHLSALAA